MKNATSWIVCLMALCLSCPVRAQDLLTMQRNGYYTFIYQVPADTALLLDEHPRAFDYTMSHFRLVDSFITSAGYTRSLPAGYYMEVSIRDRQVHYELRMVTDIMAALLPDRHSNKLLLRTRAGVTVTDATVIWRHKRIRYNKEAGAYLVPLTTEKGGILVVETTDGQKLIYDYATNAPEIHPLQWALMRLKQAFARGRWHPSKKEYQPDGYILFSQPKYKPGDTVYVKAYLLHRGARAYTEPLNIRLSRSRWDEEFNRTLATGLRPVSPGVYSYSFVVNDSFEIDRTYNLSFTTSRGKKLRAESLKIEDYLLDKYTCSFHVEDVDYTVPVADTVRMRLAVKDQNDMYAMDSRVRITAMHSAVESWYREQDCVPDTLFVVERLLSSTGDTRINIPVDWLPEIGTQVYLNADFINSAGEHKTISETVKLDREPVSLTAKQSNDTVRAILYHKGMSAAGSGYLRIENTETHKVLDTRAVDFPYQGPADEYATKYIFWTMDGTDTVRAEVIAERYESADVMVWRTDSIIGLSSDHWPLYYTFYSNGMVAYRGVLRQPAILIPDRSRQVYQLTAQYMKGGTDHTYTRTVYPRRPYPLLQVSMQGKEHIYPGQKDTIAISIKDIKGKPVRDADVTALSYTQQFNEKLWIPGPRYHQPRRRAASTQRPVRGSDLDEAYATANVDLGSCRWWLSRMHLDTMPYYSLLYGTDAVRKHFTRDTSLKAQFAPYVLEHGDSKRIYMIYVDGDLAWYDTSAAYMPYAIPVSAGEHKIDLRTTDRLIHLYPVPIDDGGKTELMIEWDSVTANADVMPAELVSSEKEMLRRRYIAYQMERNWDSSYIWQSDSRRYFTIPPFSNATRALSIPIGPLSFQPATFYRSHRFTLNFDPEREYAFSFTAGVARLERTQLFSAPHIVLHEYNEAPYIRFGEVLRPHPDPDEVTAVVEPHLYEGTWWERGQSSPSLSIRVLSDSAIAYARLYRTDTPGYDKICTYNASSVFYNLPPGTYAVRVLTRHGYSYLHRGIVVSPHSSCHATIHTGKFEATQQTLLSHATDQLLLSKSRAADIAPIPDIALAGKMLDGRGHAMPYARVWLTNSLNGYAYETMADRQGYFTFPMVRAGSYTFSGTLIYCDTVHVPVFVTAGRTTLVLGVIHKWVQTVNDIVVMSRGGAPLLDRADTRVETVESNGYWIGANYRGNQMNGTDLNLAVSKVPGVMIGSGSGAGGGRADEVQYIVNGHRMLSNVVVSGNSYGELRLGPNSVSAKYGDTAGAVTIEDKYKDAGKLRKNFRDYAYWQPQLATGPDGKVSFTTQYPDDITTWRSYAVAMTRHHRAGMGTMEVKSFKDCMAELATPQFLVTGDSASAAVKITDYLHRPIPLTARFVWDSVHVQQNDVTVTDILTDRVVINVAPDEQRKEIKAAFDISTQGGFGDGEERAITIVPSGTMETVGAACVLTGDTSIDLPVDTALGVVTLHLQNDVLDVLLDEIENVRQYPYWCMEQTASRLILLHRMEQIYAALDKPTGSIAREKEVCINKLQKGQLISGAYGWWEYSPASVRMTTYVLAALNESNAANSINTRDAYAYLDAALPLMSVSERLDVASLYAGQADRGTRVPFILKTVTFDSLGLYQRLLYLKAELQSKSGDSAAVRHWRQVLQEQHRTLFGGSYWGEDSWSWYSGRPACTVLAYEIAGLRNDVVLQQQIIQYFLETRSHSGWRNTAESARIVSAILPRILSGRHGDLSAPVTEVAGAAVTKYPYDARINPQGSALHIAKRGAATVYLSASQQFLNKHPEPVASQFIVRTVFGNGNTEQNVLRIGERSEIVAEVQASSYSEYLMIEVPIPAGCTYGDKPQSSAYGEVHREYFKDKVVIFCESMQPGVHRFTIPIESRYKGSYTVNPARVQLMYFPSLYGRNAIRRIRIE